MIKAASSLTVEFRPGQVIRFEYRNWQGVVATRTARVVSLSYGSTEWHPSPQWVLRAIDLEKKAMRLFALSDMKPVD